MKKLTTEDIIYVFREVHGDKYDYSKVEYDGVDKNVIIICSKHGDFKQTPYTHKTGSGCKKCHYENNNKSRKLNTKKFIKKAKLVHENFYDYSLVDYTNSISKVKIICPEHGLFEQEANGHLQGRGCLRCGYESFESIPIKLKNLMNNYRISIRDAYKRRGFNEATKPSRILGCDWQTFKQHLEDNPYGFKIGNKGLDLDHIIPLIEAKTEEEVLKLFNYKNYQLLPSYYNRHIKRSKPFNREHFNNWLNNNSK